MTDNLVTVHGWKLVCRAQNEILRYGEYDWITRLSQLCVIVNVVVYYILRVGIVKSFSQGRKHIRFAERKRLQRQKKERSLDLTAVVEQNNQMKKKKSRKNITAHKTISPLIFTHHISLEHLTFQIQSTISTRAAFMFG